MVMAVRDGHHCSHVLPSAEEVQRGLPRPVGIGIRPADGLEASVPPLYPIEAEALGPRAVEKRRVLFALGRAAARDGLGALGMQNAAIPRTNSGAPVWPDGFVGSISHSDEAAIAVVGRRHDYLGLGVDLEERGRGLSARAARLVCRPSEMAWVDVESGTERLLRLFSAKEAIFKALFPIEEVWLGFADAELSWHAEAGGFFEARVLKSVGDGFSEGFSLKVNSTVGPTRVLSTAFVETG